MPYGEGNPQLEDGFARIANEILEALARTNLMDSESRCIHYLWRKTYGWHSKGSAQAKKTDIISYGQWVSGTGLERSNLIRALNQLVGRHIITKDTKNRPGKNSIIIWGFQKKYTQWNGYHPLQYRLGLVAGEPPLISEPVASQPPVASQVVAGQPLVTNEVVAGGQKVVAGEPPEVVAGEPPTIDNIDNTIDKEEEETLAVFKTMTGWKFQEDEDLAWLKDLTHDFPNITVQKVKGCRDFWSTQPTKHKGQWKNHLRNWLTKDLALKKGFTAATKPPPGKIATQEELNKWNQ